MSGTPRLAAPARVLFVAGYVLVTALSVLPAEELPDVGLWDKAQHFLAWAALGLTGGAGWPARPATWRIVWFLLVSGVALEAIQLFVPGRIFAVGDGVANLAGVLAGIALALALARKPAAG